MEGCTEKGINQQLRNAMETKNGGGMERDTETEIQQLFQSSTSNGGVMETSHFKIKMSLEVLACTLSFLDINDYEDCSGKVLLFHSIGLTNLETHFVHLFWLKETTFETFLTGRDVSWVGNPLIKTIRHRTYWTRNSKFHRSSGPAVITPCCFQWFRRGRRHRGHDEPALEWKNGEHEEKSWYWEGLEHRENDKPAFVSNNEEGQAWYWHGKRHRENGPACVRLNGNKKWYVNGVFQKKVRIIK